MPERLLARLVGLEPEGVIWEPVLQGGCRIGWWLVDRHGRVFGCFDDEAAAHENPRQALDFVYRRERYSSPRGGRNSGDG